MGKMPDGAEAMSKPRITVTIKNSANGTMACNPFAQALADIWEERDRRAAEDAQQPSTTHASEPPLGPMGGSSRAKARAKMCRHNAKLAARRRRKQKH